MKRIRIPSWQSQSLLARPCPSSHTASRWHRRSNHLRLRPNSTQAHQFSSSPIPPYAASATVPESNGTISSTPKPQQRLEDIPSPPVSASLSSAKLAALHARLSLPQRFPLQTLARTLVDRTADSETRFNNAQLAVLGSDIMGYYMSEHLICNYPRLPMDVLFAAQEAYVGPKALMTVSKEWGVEEAAEPGGEVDAGLLQFRHTFSYDTDNDTTSPLDATQSEPTQGRANQSLARQESWRRGMSSRIVYDDQFGLEPSSTSQSTSSQQQEPGGKISLSIPQDAHANFVRALIGALHLHTGTPSTKRFFQNHFLTRTLDLSSIFHFRHPGRDLSRLCLREGFEPPIARLVSETGRNSAHPVFVVGVYSGRDKLGEAVGGSLEEAKSRAAAAALKGWYLYSPGKGVVTVPSSAGEEGVRWRANMVDPGEVVT